MKIVQIKHDDDYNMNSRKITTGRTQTAFTILIFHVIDDHICINTYYKCSISDLLRCMHKIQLTNSKSHKSLAHLSLEWNKCNIPNELV